MMVLVTRLADKGVRRPLEPESSLFQDVDDLCSCFQRYKNVIGEVCRDEEDRAITINQPVIPGQRCSSTHTPAIANGVVNSNTRWPASNPSPSTCNTT